MKVKRGNMYKALAIIIVLTTLPFVFLLLPQPLHKCTILIKEAECYERQNLLPPLKIISMRLVQFIMKFHALAYMYTDTLLP